MENFQNAVNDLVVGLGDKLNPTQEWEYKYLDEVISNLERLRDVDTYYLYALPKEFVKQLLLGNYVINTWKRKCRITNINYVKSHNDYAVDLVWENGNTKWRMWLGTIFEECRFISIKKNVLQKYFTKLTPGRVDSLIVYLKQKKETYAKWYEQNTKRSNNIIGRELAKHKQQMVVERVAVRKAIRSIQQDSKVIADAFNSTLTQNEQQTLINWLADNVYSMRLYVVRGSRWDKAISELYPDEIYGSPRRTIPSELSKDSINGYVSINTLSGNVPYDILKKITHKQNSEDVIKQNKGSSKFRINNYLLVLYLLNNYNKYGFKLGKTNLNKDITLVSRRLKL